MKKILKSPLFWILFSLASVASVAISFYLFPRAFSLIAIDMRMDRAEALTKAALLAQHGIGPRNYSSATSFSTDGLVQIYAEVKSKNKNAFTTMIEENLYSPYTWQVRHFKEFEPHEATFYFTPTGDFYGFYESLSEKTEGAALTSEEAQPIAQKSASDLTHINFSDYSLVETSQETQPSKRIDHTFVYERLNKKLIDAPYRLKLVVSGDKLTQLIHSVKVPDSFIRTYHEIRSANVSIASAAHMAMILLYFIGCALLGLFYFMRRQKLLWHNPVLWGLFISLLKFFVQLNKFPLMWMYYSTSSSMNQFVLNTLFSLLQGLLKNTFIYSFIILAGESLTRAAFGKHIQFWKLWSFEPAHSKEVAGRTVAGYLLPPFHLVYVLSLYIFAQRYLGWWNPSDTLLDPNILACYFPWFESVAQAFNAGFTEEFIFRALPLATAALLGIRFGKKYLWIAAAFIIQIIIFGAAHANYPAQPAYARVIELIVPSTIFGSLYLFFGLLPAILSHFIFDVILMSIPVFSFHGSGAWLNKLLVIALSGIPLIIVFFAWVRSKGLITLPERYYNYKSDTSISVEIKEAPEAISKPPLIVGKKLYATIFSLGILGTILWLISTPFTQEAPPLTLSRADAIAQAQTILKEKNIFLSDEWQTLARVDGTFQDSSYEKNQHTFIWQQGGKELYRTLLNTFYLHPPFWLIRFARFTGTVSQRAEEYHVYLTKNGTLLRFRHSMPEDASAPSLTKEKARIVAHNYLKNELKNNPENFSEIKAIAEKLPNRTDWLFTFADKKINIPDQGQARITIEISGDTVTDARTYIHIPEEWKRHKELVNGRIEIMKKICSLFFTVLFLMSLIIVLSNFATKFSILLVAIIGFFLFTLSLASFVGLWPYIVSKFNTSQPVADQSFRILSSTLTSLFSRAGILGVLIALITTMRTIYATSKKHFNYTIGLGVSIGLFMVGIDSAASLIHKQSVPIWADFSPLNGIPILIAVLNLLIFYLNINIECILIVAVANYAHYIKRISYVIIAPFFITAFVCCSLSSTNVTGIINWFAAGSLLGAAFFLLYYFILRYNYALIPIANSVYISSFFIQQAVFNSYPHAFVANVVALIVFNSIGMYWSWHLSKYNEKIS